MRTQYLPMTYIHDNLQKLERFLRQVKQNTERSY